jgi:anti-anti-sigma factor
VGIPETVPLYACERCGYTSAEFRSEATRLHRLEYPNCDGVMRIIFRSEERYRGELYIHPRAGASSEPAAAPERQAAGRKQPVPVFALRETVEEGQAVRLTLLGDLDLTGAEAPNTRLGDLKAEGRPCRLDLSQLNFIDSSGIQALLLALTDVRWNGWSLEVAPEVSPTVQRAAQIVGIAQVLRPSPLAKGSKCQAGACDGSDADQRRLSQHDRGALRAKRRTVVDRPRTHADASVSGLCASRLRTKHLLPMGFASGTFRSKQPLPSRLVCKRGRLGTGRAPRCTGRARHADNDHAPWSDERVDAPR